MTMRRKEDETKQSDFSSFSPIKVGDFDFEKKCEELAERTDGFSGREIAKLLAACQVCSFSSILLSKKIFLLSPLWQHFLGVRLCF